VVESSATGWEIKFRSNAFPGSFTLPVRIGGGVEVVSRLLARMVKALARDMLKQTSSVSRWKFELFRQQRVDRDAVPHKRLCFLFFFESI
jgi:hypothetical protein